MALTFLCASERRRALLQQQTAGPGDRLDGIDLLLVLDEHDPNDPVVTSPFRQRILLVRFLFGDELANLGDGSVEILGGVRVRDPRIIAVRPMADLDPNTVDPLLARAINDATPALLARTLVVLVEETGDFSTYRLRLLPWESHPTGRPFFEAFDRRSVEVDFSFKVECPAPFDCAPDEFCEQGPVEAPELDYLARDFGSFRRLMMDRLALLQPGEPSQAAATLRTTVVEALAYAADRAAYHQDAVATEAYLGTARLRRSVRRHARLLDYPMHEGCNARTFVHLAIRDGLEVAPGELREGAVFLTRVPESATVVPAHELAGLGSSVLGFQAAMDGPALSSVHNEIAVHTWGDEDCCLLAGATSADLVDEGLRLVVGDLLLFEQVRSPQSGQPADADPDERFVVRITAIDGPVQDLLMPGQPQVLTVHWDPADAPDHDVPIVGDPIPYLVARANLVLADHGMPFEEDPVLDTHGHAERVSSRLSEGPLTYGAPVQANAAASVLLRQDPRAAMPHVTLQGEGEGWQAVRDLLASAASATEFVVEMGDDRLAALRFGDNVMGRRPTDFSVARSQERPAGTEAPFVAAYRVGNGPRGNLGSDALRHLVEEPSTVAGTVVAAVSAVRNPVPAVGGTAPERVEEVQLYAPVAFRTQERAVTVEDWADVAARHPRVARAMARFRWTGSWSTVFVHVDLVGGEPLEDDLADELRGFLDRYRMAGIDLELRGPVYVPLDIALSVCVEDGVFPEQVDKTLRRVFGRGYLSDGSPAFFHPDQYTFGQSVHLSALIARATAVPGVRWLDSTPTPATASAQHRFKRLWAPDDGTLAAGRIDLGDLEIARCDSDPNAPENGQLRFHVRSPSERV